MKTAFTGRLDNSTGVPQVVNLGIALHKLNGLILPAKLSFTLDLPNHKVTGGLDEEDGDAATPLTAWINPWQPYHGVGPLSPYSVTYTAALQPTGAAIDNPSFPQGNGWLTLSISTSGFVSIAGRTADGMTITESTTVSHDGDVPLSNSFLSGSALMHGWLKISPGPGSDFVNLVLADNGAIQWVRTQPSGRIAPFVLHNLAAAGGRYFAPGKGALVLGLLDVAAGSNNAGLVFSKAGIATAKVSASGSFHQLLRVTKTNTSVFPTGTVANPAAMRLSFVPATGVYSGSFTLSDSNPLLSAQTLIRSVAYSGVLAPHGGSSFGYFLLNQLPAVAGQTALNTPQLSGLATLDKL